MTRRKSICHSPRPQYCQLESRKVLTSFLGTGVGTDDGGVGVAAFGEGPLVVTNTNDSGTGSLRWAIEESNDQIGVQEILFNLPGGSNRKIVLATELPEIFDEVQILGHTQPGFSFGDVAIEIDGSGIPGTEVDGLWITADYTEVFGLAMVGFSNDGIQVNADHVVVGNSYLGIDLSGAEKGNNNGIRVEDSLDVTILDNVVSGNDFAGILITGSSTEVGVVGNLVGTNVAANAAIPNYVGIMNQGRANALINNVVAGNEWVGVALNNADVSGSETTVLGNYIGLSESGVQIPNATTGLFVLSSSNVIGGTSAGQGNVIAGNGQHGIMLRGAANNSVIGNHIGITKNDVEMGNGFVGLRVIGSANFVAQSNIISGNDTIGLFVGGAFTTDAQIVSNRIGTNSGGTADMGNSGVGFIINGAPNAYIANNLISGNDKGGFSSVGGDTHYQFVSNLVGTDFRGTQRINNTGFGMFIFSDNNQIGASGQGNVISDSNLGLAMGAANGNMVAYNTIGTDAQRTYDLGMNFGVYFFQSGSDNVFSNNVIDWVVTGVRNTSTGDSNTYTQNVFGYTSFMGIDNGLPGHQNSSTANGAHMVAPALVQHTLIGTNVLEVTYWVDAPVGKLPATIEFFVANFTGSGRRFVGTDVYSEVDSATGEKTISLDVTGLGLFLNDKIVATATDVDGNTSEFSLFV